MRNVTNHYNYDHKTKKGEINTLPSQTIPNQTMSLQDMVDKFTVSSTWPKEPIPEQFESFQNLELPDITNMDKTEQAQLALDIKNDIIETQLELKELQEITKQKQALAKETEKAIKDAPTPDPEE